MSKPAPNLMILVADYAQAMGATPLNRHDACWDSRIDDHWRIVANGHRQEIQHNGVRVPPFSVYVEFNGFPAGILDAYGGLMAAGEAANARALARALRSATGRARTGAVV